MIESNRRKDQRIFQKTVVFFKSFVGGGGLFGTGGSSNPPECRFLGWIYPRTLISLVDLGEPPSSLTLSP